MPRRRIEIEGMTFIRLVNLSCKWEDEPMRSIDQLLLHLIEKEEERRSKLVLDKVRRMGPGDAQAGNKMVDNSHDDH